MRKLNFQSHCKINIGLKIERKREDGYHDINTVYQELLFHDIITLKKTKSGNSFACNIKNLENNDNLCVKAWILMADKFGLDGISINLKKKIPVGAGLGGGSSNAAATLKGVNELFQLGLSSKDLKEVAIKIGSDVPFFINGGAQIGKGVGDVLTEVNPFVDSSVLLIMPKIRIDTSWAYGQIKNVLDEDNCDINFRRLIGEKKTPFKMFKNDFEIIIFPAYPEIGRIKSLLLKSGARYASLSGSGSTVFGLFDDEAKAILAESEFSSEYHSIITRPKTGFAI